MKKLILLLVMMMLCAVSSSSVLAAETKTVVTVSATTSKSEETQWVLRFEPEKIVTIKGVKYTLKGDYQVYRGAKGGLYILVEKTHKYYLTEAMKKLLNK